MSTATQEVPKGFAAAPRRDMFEEFLQREAAAEVDRQAVLYGYSDDLMSVFVKEKDKLEFQLPGLRAEHSRKVPALAKGEKRLAVLEACVAILQERVEDEAKVRAEGHLLTDVLSKEAEEKRLFERFRQEEREAADIEERKRFLAWKDNLGL